LLCALTACRATLAADIPIEDFFKRSEFLQLSLSPDGRKVAALVPVGGRFNLAVLELADRKNIRVITRETIGDVVRFWWVNDHRLVFTLGDMIEQPGLQRDGGGLIALNVDGTAARVLAPTVSNNSRRGSFARGATYLSSISTPENPTDDILVLSNDRSAKYPDVYRINTKSGDKTLLTFDTPGNVVRWVVDHDHVVRGAVGFDEKETFAGYYRESADAPWRKISEFKRDAAGFRPVAFDGDNKTLLVASGIGRDKVAIFKLDMQTGKVGDLIVGHDAVDVAEGLVYDRLKKQQVGIRINAYKPETHWFDAEWAAVQKTVDTALPGTINRLTRRADGKIFLVTSQSDTQPAFWSVLDMEKRTLERLVSSREWIKPEQMSEMRAFRFIARDGLEIPAYLTVPRGSSGKNLPLIVHPHGGPWARDSWGFNPEVQFLASRGFAVLQPNFRMSTGFGGRHFRAGFRQWGLAMQDDITDAVQWAIKEGVADPERICIYGASYGGMRR
jgi:dipeptidyl aminopeptidase/acylaminoacyl peptidase